MTSTAHLNAALCFKRDFIARSNDKIVSRSRKSKWTKAHIRYLECVLIEKENNNGTSVVINSASSDAKLPESDAAEMNTFLKKCLQLLPVLGVSDFNEKVDQASDSKELILLQN